MGGKKKQVEQIAADNARERDIEDAIRAIAMRRTGTLWGEIAQQLGRSQIEVEALAKAGYEHLLGQQDAETLRAESEDRYDAVIRAANLDYALAETVSERNALLRTILAAEQARVRLLGIAVKPGGDDAA